MACEFICDGCGRRASADGIGSGWFKPRAWYQRSDTEGIQDACSRECITTIAQRTGKTDVVAPF